MHLIRRPFVSLTLLALAGCGGGDLVLPNEGQPTEVEIVRGDRQTGTILEAAPDSLVIRVSDPFGNPVAGVEIAWSAVDGGEVRPTTTVTGNDGRAATQRVLGEQPGTYGTTAVATVLPEDVVSFTTTAVAAKLVLVTQPGATAVSGAPIDPQPVLQLEDPSGNPLQRQGVSVSVQIATGDGGLRGATTRTTDANGAVAFSDLAIVGAPGARTLIFAASGYSPAISTPVSLGVGAPASVAIAAGDGQSAAIESKVGTAPAVLVRDAAGTPVANVAVTFAVTSGGGSVDGGNAITAADGVATVGSWTLGQTLGSNTLSATVQADNVTGNPVTFTATATPGPPNPDRSTVTATPGTIAASNGSASSAISITVRDGRGNPLGGQTVTLEATGSGVTLSQPAATDGSGATNASFSATSTGDHVIRARIGDITVGSATVTVAAGPIAASRTSVTAPDGTAGAATVVDIELEDEFGNPAPGAAGQLAVAVSGANTGGLTVTDQGNGRYRAEYVPRAIGTDQIDVRVGGQPVPGTPFPSAVKAGPPDPAHTTALVPDGVFGQTLNIVVFLTDAQGNRIGADLAVIKVGIQGIGPLDVTYAGDGIYVARWTPRVIGTFKVDITLGETPIGGSPYTTHIGFF
jgi:adhesin/invasin